MNCYRRRNRDRHAARHPVIQLVEPTIRLGRRRCAHLSGMRRGRHRRAAVQDERRHALAATLMLIAARLAGALPIMDPAAPVLCTLRAWRRGGRGAIGAPEHGPHSSSGQMDRLVLPSTEGYVQS
jgi:hypothetical protein